MKQLVAMLNNPNINQEVSKMDTIKNEHFRLRCNFSQIDLKKNIVLDKEVGSALRITAREPPHVLPSVSSSS